MFKINNYKIIAEDKKRYLSFPDVIQSPKNKNRLFLVYREGNGHHPVRSKLILMISNDLGETWSVQQEFISDIDREGSVWNCPRLSYIDDRILCIVCDRKSGIFETRAKFDIVMLTSTTEGQFFRISDVDMPGMVPDRIVKFKNKLFCANHKIKDRKNSLVQLVSWSRDNGRTWYDTNVVANDDSCQFCEASIVNMGQYLLAYLRENSGHKRNIYIVKSTDGIYWYKPKKLGIYGQRVTAVKNGRSVIGSYRRTSRCGICLFEHNVITDNIKTKLVDSDYPYNLYNCGYTGLAKIENNKYFLTYYIPQNNF